MRSRDAHGDRERKMIYHVHDYRSRRYLCARSALGQGALILERHPEELLAWIRWGRAVAARALEVDTALSELARDGLLADSVEGEYLVRGCCLLLGAEPFPAGDNDLSRTRLTEPAYRSYSFGVREGLLYMFRPQAAVLQLILGEHDNVTHVVYAGPREGTRA